jgi:hypothetical protein
MYFIVGEHERACVCTTHITMHNASDIAMSARARLRFCGSGRPLVLFQDLTTWQCWNLLTYCPIRSFIASVPSSP